MRILPAAYLCLIASSASAEPFSLYDGQIKQGMSPQAVDAVISKLGIDAGTLPGISKPTVEKFLRPSDGEHRNLLFCRDRLVQYYYNTEYTFEAAIDALSYWSRRSSHDDHTFFTQEENSTAYIQFRFFPEPEYMVEVLLMNFNSQSKAPFIGALITARDNAYDGSCD